MTDEVVVHDVAHWIRGDQIKIEPRRKRGVEGKPVIELSREPVKNRGERLHKILWRGKQWAVTEYGIEALDGTYPMERDRLLEGLLDPGDRFHPFPLHMAGKTWVDVDELTTAWMVALVLHGYGSKQIAKAVRKCFGELPPWGTTD